VLLTKYPHTSICVAGGVFANVKLNQRIKDRFNVSIFIQPAMGDEGLVLGAAWQYMSETTSNFEGVGPLRHMYLGTHYTRADIMSVVENNSLYQIEPFTSYEQTADLLANGEIIGVFDGRMEFGPRALGARSIVVDPRDKKVNDLLNMRLQRSDFMPFAPSVLSEYADALFQNVEHARHAAEFMTITFDVKHEWQKKIPAIVHVDGTARPQLVRKDRNQSYWMLIHAFYEKTGIPLIMNTSFNMHEEPIVSSPQDALRSLETGAVDSILFNYEFFVRLRKK